MQNQNEDQSKKTMIAIISIVVAIVMAIITISIVGINIQSSNEANIVNETAQETYAENSATSENNDSKLLSDEDMTRVKQEIYTLLHKINPDAENDDVVIRWDSFSTESGVYPKTTFLADVDSYQQTYRVSVDQERVAVSCPSLGESKYPESFCIGNNGEYDDSINVVFGRNLPYSGETSNGEYFYIDRNSLESMENINDRYLEVRVRACPWTDEAINRAREATNEVISSLGASPNLFDIRIDSAGGCHGE